MRHVDDHPTIGLILCKAKNRTVVEYALRDMNRPIGVAAFSMQSALPPALQEALPSVEDLAAELDWDGPP